jgi:hypothetical protein
MTSLIVSLSRSILCPASNDSAWFSSGELEITRTRTTAHSEKERSAEYLEILHVRVGHAALERRIAHVEEAPSLGRVPQYSVVPDGENEKCESLNTQRTRVWVCGGRDCTYISRCVIE